MGDTPGRETPAPLFKAAIEKKGRSGDTPGPGRETPAPLRVRG